MIIQDKNTVTGELSYFEMTLLLYLKESHLLKLLYLF
mgnify:CR=1 FL=1